MEKIFDYFYATEIENYLYLQVPIALIKEERFKKISAESKLLYSLLLNRTALSIRNNWKDEHGRVYIIYTMNEIMEDLNCYHGKANKSMKELKEIGLVRVVRQGLTKPNLIYVMNFSTDLKYEKKGPKDKQYCDESLKCDFSNSENAPFAKQKMPESQTIYIDRIKNNFNQTDISINRRESDDSTENNLPKLEKNSDTDMIDTKISETFINQTKAETISNALAEIVNSDNITETISNKVSLEELREQYPDRLEEINLLYEINCEIMLNSNPIDKIRISKTFIPIREIQEQFALLEKKHYDYVLHSLANNDNRYKIKGNTKNYCRTALFHAIRTIGYYYDKPFVKKQDSTDDFFTKIIRKSMKF